MKKMIGLLFILAMTGCACAKKRTKEDLYHTAAIDANQQLSVCQADNDRMRVVLARQQKQLVAYKRVRAKK